jgi:phosphate acetyltransferase
VFPEGSEDRVLRAAEQVLARGIAGVIILGDGDDIRRRPRFWALDIAARR